jgi:hypothetical protein
LTDVAVPSLFAVQDEEKKVESVIPAGDSDVCHICGEKLEKFYDEEEDQWMIKNAIRIGDKVIAI